MNDFIRRMQVTFGIFGQQNIHLPTLGVGLGLFHVVS
jgi:hypothetical protein